LYIWIKIFFYVFQIKSVQQKTMSIKVEDSRTDNNLIAINIDQERNSRKQKKDKEKEEEEEKDQNAIPPEAFQQIQNNLMIKRIEKRMYNIEQCYFNPQTLTIQGYNQLRNIPGQHWKSRIYTLFDDLNLPHYWILDIWESPSHKSKIPFVVYIQLITFQTKMFVKSVLTEYFTNQNSNINIID
jgi:hypothetical protein